MFKKEEEEEIKDVEYLEQRKIFWCVSLMNTPSRIK
jgi:hypothetical protein